MPDIIHKHKHVKTKYVHVFHPKVVHTEIPEHSISYLHARNDPNIGLINGGYPQPLLNTAKNRHNEFRISEEDFQKWRQEQQRKAVEKRRRLQQQYQPDDDDENVNTHEYDENIEDEEQDINYEEEDLYKKHKANKANSAALSSKKEKKKHRNHNYNQDFDSSNSDKIYANFPTRKSSKRPIRPSQRNPHDDSKNFQVYGTSNVDAESTNVHQQFLNVDPTSVNPAYYSTLPKHAELNKQDDIYSGLMSKKFNKNIADKSKLLADINYSRKQQTKNLLQKIKGQ